MTKTAQNSAELCVGLRCSCYLHMIYVAVTVKYAKHNKTHQTLFHACA